MKEKFNMSCQNVQKMIPDFIADRLSINELEDFMTHLEKCNECREELTIQFLIQEGLIRTDEGENFDLQLELDDTLHKATKKIQTHNLFRQSIMIVEIIGIVALLVAIVLLIH